MSFFHKACKERAWLVLQAIKNGKRNPEVMIALEMEKLIEKYGGKMSGVPYANRTKVGLIGCNASAVQALFESNCLLQSCWDLDKTGIKEINWDTSDYEKVVPVVEEFDPLLPLVFSPSVEAELRLEIMKKHQETLLLANAAIHKSAFVCMDAYLGIGTMIFPLVMVGSNSAIGRGVTIGHAATICSDVKVGNGAKIEPNVTVCDKARIGEGCTIGAGAVVSEGVVVGAGTKIQPGQIVKFNVGERRERA